MAAFVDDGYVTSGYVVPPKDIGNREDLFDPVSFEYRVATRREVILCDNEIEKLNLKADDKSTALKIEDLSCKFVADHLVSWDITDRSGNSVEINAVNTSRLNPYLFGRMFRMIRNTEGADVKPEKEKETGDNEMQKN